MAPPCAFHAAPARRDHRDPRRRARPPPSPATYPEYSGSPNSPTSPRRKGLSLARGQGRSSRPAVRLMKPSPDWPHPRPRSAAATPEGRKTHPPRASIQEALRSHSWVRALPTCTVAYPRWCSSGAAGAAHPRRRTSIRVADRPPIPDHEAVFGNRYLRAGSSYPSLGRAGGEVPPTAHAPAVCSSCA